MQPLNSADKMLLEGWLAMADLDLRAAERMYADDAAFYGYHVPFACQQAVEKYAKAVLVAHSLPVRKTHDLPALLHQLKAVTTFSVEELDDADKLADYAVEIRYPPYHPLLTAEVTQALSIARHFCTALRPLAVAFLL